MDKYKKMCIERGLKIGQKIKVSQKIQKTGAIITRKGVVTALYPHIFTAELKTQKNIFGENKNVIRTSFLYSQVLNGEVRLWN